MNERNNPEEELLLSLAEKLKLSLARFGTLAPNKGDYWVSGIDAAVASVDVFVFQKLNFTPDLLADCASLLDDYPEHFRVRFIEAGKDGKPLAPLGGLQLDRYGAGPI